MVRNSHLEWMVKYEPGILLARGYNDGKEVLTDKVETTGDPVVVKLIADRSNLRADGEDVSVITVQASDAQERPVPTAGNEITFNLTGPGRIIGVGNGDPSSHEPDVFTVNGPADSMTSANWKRSLFNGLAQVVVQSTREPGEITLMASSPGLSPKALKLQTQPVALHIVADSK
jgi:beta-galactosidase